MLDRPRLQDLEERAVADLLAQRLQRHRSPAVDRTGEHGVALRIRDHDLPERIAGRTAVVEHEVLVRRADSLVLVPQVLREARESLVEPDVLARADRDRVAEALVRELMRDRAGAAHRRVKGAASASPARSRSTGRCTWRCPRWRRSNQTSRPLPITSMPAGTVTRNVHVALSLPRCRSAARGHSASLSGLSPSSEARAGTGGGQSDRCNLGYGPSTGAMTRRAIGRVNR